MDSLKKSFQEYAKKARMALSNPGDSASQRWILASVVVPAALFVVLSPGLLLNLPPNSKETCKKQVPLPSGEYADCNFATGEHPDEEALNPICKKQKECHSVGASGYTGYWAIIVHSLVFVILAGIIGGVIRRMA